VIGVRLVYLICLVSCAPNDVAAIAARACAGIKNEARKTAPFDKANVLAVEPFRAIVWQPKGSFHFRRQGVLVRVKADGGDATASWLEQVLTCQARSATAASESPLAVPGTSVHASALEEWIEIEITNDDSARAEEVYRRAALLWR
jgi:hypothetical protein